MLSSEATTRCQDCNINIYTEDCANHHKKRVCRWGWKCPKCNIFQSRNKFFTSQKDIEKKHVCGHRICNYCGKVKEQNHFCSLRKLTIKEEHTNLAFIRFEYTGYNPATCHKCFSQKPMPCDFCRTKNLDEKPIACCLLQEEEGRNSFSQNIFFDSTLENSYNILDMTKEREALKLTQSYFPSNICSALAPEGQKTRFGKRKTPYSTKTVFCKQFMTTVDKLLDYILNNNFSNSAILAGGQDLYYVLQGFHLNGFAPNVVKRQNHIMLIEEKCLGMRFIHIENYIPLSEQDQVEETTAIFFPLRWIRPDFFSYTGTPPKETDYFSFEDSNQDILNKKQFVKKQRQPWSFLPEFVTYISKKTHQTALSILKYLRHTFEVQIVMQKHLTQTAATHPNQLFHPMNMPIFTGASYAFNLFKLFSRTAKDIKSIKQKIMFKSSKGEIEYTSFLRWKNQNMEITDAWAPKGQKDLQFTRPDAISSSHIWYYNGCFYHGHSPQECLFKSRADKTKQEEKLKEFYSKLNLIRQNYSHLKIETMWECVWRQQKKRSRSSIFHKTCLQKSSDVPSRPA